MKEITIERYDVNQAALQETLEAQLSPYFVGVGISTQRGVSVFLVNNAPREVEVRAHSLVEKHDNSVKTADQQANEQRNHDLGEVTANAARILLNQITQAQADNLVAGEALANDVTDLDMQEVVCGLVQREAEALQREIRLVQALGHIVPSFIQDDMSLPFGALASDQ